MIWRTVWRVAPLNSVPLFLYFLVCKAFGWRPAANHGIERPASLPEIPSEQIPQDVRAALQPCLEDCLRAGFQPAFYLKPPYIGGKQAYSAVLLDPSGLIFATVVWMRLTRGSLTRSTVIIACHSLDLRGNQLTTGPIAPEHWNPELIPPFHEVLRLPIQTRPSDVLATHQVRIESAKLVRLDRESLSRQVLQSIHQLFDFMVQKGYYVKLSQREIEQLMGDRSHQPAAVVR
jgi:hypothetical protein